MRGMHEIAGWIIASCRTWGFWGFVEAALTFLLIKFRLFLSLKFNAIDWRRGKRRIFYIDYFAPQNSNFYWLKAFHKFGRVKIFDIMRENRELIKEGITNFKPNHIHLGSSVKDTMVPPQLLSDVKKELNCTISVFYGDAEYSPYHCELAKVVDYIYISNVTHIKINKEKGYHNFKYMLCPTDPEIFNYKNCKKSYDLVFIANNTGPSRLSLLKNLADKFNLKVFGNGWANTGLNYGNPIYGKKFSRACNQTKICLGIVDPEWTNLEAYFSNRLINTLATRSFCIQTYTQGLEKVFTNHKHLVWYTSDEDLFQQVEYYLEHDMEREKIAVEGQKEVYHKYTYVESIRRILHDAKMKDKENKINRALQNALTNEIVKGVEKHQSREDLSKSDNTPVRYNLNFDDLLPCYHNFKLLEKLVRLFPEIKITIFMPINSRDWGDNKNNILDHPKWCRKVAKLPSENFEIALHGYYHHLNDEDKTPAFKYLSKEEVIELLLKCEEAFKKAGIRYTKGFRPPRWEISKGTEQALGELGYLYLSDSPRFYEEHKDIEILQIFSNSDIKENEERVMYKACKNVLLDSRKYYIHRGHLVGRLENTLTKANFDNIVRIIRSFENVEFKFLSEIAQEIGGQERER